MSRASRMQRAASDARTHLLVTVLLVIAVGAVAVTVHELADLRRASPTARSLFTAAWTLANLVIVVRGLRRIRDAVSAARSRRP